MVISKRTGKMLEGFKRENDMIQFLLLKRKSLPTVGKGAGGYRENSQADLAVISPTDDTRRI